ncbi:hypothetical protein [Photorhabdus bodei]|uniref:hypothetical protein n=2 Tax=Photorhabdus bodei TaxID=2029681 RepID=UPI0030EB75EB
MHDGEGREIDFRHTVILMISNLGSDQLIALLAQQPDAPNAALHELLHPMFRARQLQASKTVLPGHAHYRLEVRRCTPLQAMGVFVRLPKVILAGDRSIKITRKVLTITSEAVKLLPYATLHFSLSTSNQFEHLSYLLHLIC